MKQKFIEKSFHKASLDRIEQVNGIIQTYQEKGYVLTLRQLYYQLVSRNIISENCQREYNKLSVLISQARRAGLIDWDALEDRTRFLRGYNTFTGPADAIQHAAALYSIDLWADQDCYLEVWVEKDALVDVVGRACSRYRVPFFSCRGFMSDSEMYAAGRRMRSTHDSGKDIVVIHLGDHDPSGVEMSSDILRRLELFSEKPGLIDFHRIALNMEQIEQFNPPPNFAKETDSRAKAYIEKYGPVSWELDALEPDVLVSLIQSHIEKYLDMEKFTSRIQQEEQETNELFRLANSIVI